MYDGSLYRFLSSYFKLHMTFEQCEGWGTIFCAVERSMYDFDSSQNLTNSLLLTTPDINRYFVCYTYFVYVLYTVFL